MGRSYLGGDGVRTIFGLSVLLPIVSIGVLCSLWSVLFGPPGLIVFGIVGLVIAVGCVFLTKHPDARDWFHRHLPNGLAGRWPDLGSLRQPLQVAISLVGVIAFASAVAMVLSSRLDGVPDDQRPVFRQRDQYTLDSHGRITVVSRSRYLLVDASAFTAWHTGILYVMLWAEHFLIFGKHFHAYEAFSGKKSPSGGCKEGDTKKGDRLEWH